MATLQPAPLTPELEAIIGTAPMVPITLDAARRSTGQCPLYVHDDAAQAMDLSPFIQVRSFTICGQLITANAGANQYPLTASAHLFITRADYERIACSGLGVAA